MTPLETPILCRAAVSLSPTATGEMMYMPGGQQKIRPIDGALKAHPEIVVQVDADGAAQLEEQRAALVANGKRPYFDFNHEGGSASFWPAQFYWNDSPEPGIYCRGEWTASGKAGVDGKEWRQFSPVFHVDNKRAKPARIVCRKGANPNMGGLVNDPAFHSILPLWARDSESGVPVNQTTNSNKMKSIVEEAPDTERETADILAENKALKAADKQRREEDADTAIQAAISRGAIAPKDQATIERWKKLIVQDEDNAALLAKQAGNPVLFQRITSNAGSAEIRARGSGVSITAESGFSIMREYGALVAQNARIPFSSETSKEKGKLARAAAAVFARDIDQNEALVGMPLDEAIRAADNPDVSLGLLSGTLVLQRALPRMAYEFPVLDAVTSDFSDSPGLLDQTETSHIILTPAVQTYDRTKDSAGRPKGWVTVSPAQSVDVPITLDEYVAVPIVFGQATLASTVRNLFGEVAPQAMYSLGKYFVDKLTAILTAANFNAYKGITVGTGVTTNGSASISAASTANMFAGQSISGTGIPSNCYIASITDGTNAKMTQLATADGAGLTFTLGGGKVPTLYPTYVKGLADFNMASLGEIAAAFDINEVPQSDRFVLLNALYHQRLAQDPNFNTFFAAMRKPEIITEGSLPKLQGLNPIKAPWFPSSSNRVGFAFHKAAALIKTRLPSDFTHATNAKAPGNVTTVTAPNGLSVLLVEYVDLRSNYAEWRPEVMLGVAPGERRAGMVLTSQ